MDNDMETGGETMSTMTKENNRLVVHKRFEMMDGTTFHFKRSYALSKVCNVALSISLQRRFTSRNVTVNCFSPGLMTSSGLFRHQTQHDMENSLAHSQFVRDNEKSVAWGGGSLAFMAVCEEAGFQSGMYWSDTDSRKGDKAEYGIEFSPSPISSNAVSEECAEDLWYLFCQLAEVPYRSILN
jgi:protochlorophyllide reductase